MWLEAAKREKLLTILQGWIRPGQRGTAGIPFKEFVSQLQKYAVRPRAFLWEPASFHHATAFSNFNHHMCISIATYGYSL